MENKQLVWAGYGLLEKMRDLFSQSENLIPKDKKGSKIHIKKKNEGKFTDYCGGKVTDACIAKAKASGNSTLIKRATFALNARHFKH